MVARACAYARETSTATTAARNFFYDLKKNKIPDFAEAKTGKGLDECLYEIILGKEGARENFSNLRLACARRS